MQTSTQPLKAIDLVDMSGLQQKWSWITRPTTYLSDAARNHPDMFRSAVTGYTAPLTIVYHPKAIEQILTNDTKQFSAPGDINRVLTPILGNRNLLNLDGDRHKRTRKLIVPSFHGERMYHYGQQIVDIARAQLQQLPPDRPFSVQDLTQQITARLILQIVFGMDSGDRYEQIVSGARQILNRFNSPLTVAALYFPNLQINWGRWSPWGRFLKLREDLDLVLYAEIADRRRTLEHDRDRTDILTLMMTATDEDGQQLSDKELRDELMLLIFAGHDTTALAMAWGMYWLHVRPDVKQTVLDELRSLGNDPDPMEIYKLPYLTAVCKETLRINPVAPFTFPRRAEEDVDLLGYHVPKGDIVLTSIYLLHQRNDLYPNPRQFDPDRFLDRQFSPYEFMPFGGGVRRCVGAALASYELKLTLATLLQSAEFALLDREEPEVKRRGVVFAPKGGIEMKVSQHK